MRSTLTFLAMSAAFALSPAALSAQPLYVPSNGAGSFGPGNYSGLPVAASVNNGNIVSGASSFGPTGGVTPPFGQANFRDSALSRGANSGSDPHFYGGYYFGSVYIHRAHQSPADLMNGPRRSTRAPFQYLPGPTQR